jgi:two-component system CheB/CheR fusion protein
MAFLFVLHLDRSHKSEIPRLLSDVTQMPVLQAAEGMPVQINHVYIIPPDAYLALNGGNLVLSPRPSSRTVQMPVDYLFRSLAEAQKNRAIGVILSGGGTDGTLAFQAIKAEGGITFAQDRTAKVPSMPRSAISDGSVDYVLPPAEIARELLRLNHHPYHAQSAPVSDPELAAINEIITLLRGSSGVDFTHYKRTTIRRRIQRRMALLGRENIVEYLAQVRDDSAELQHLFQDFLIRVTQFFREPDAFETLKERVFPQLIAGRPPDSPIRIWVAGCSTGEEVYSLAIVLVEYLSLFSRPHAIKILATDLNEAALDKARAGIYIDNIEIDVSPERLRRFFVRTDGHYQISKDIRDICVFSRHNLASDPPFSQLDLVSCRNVLIYMDAPLQRRVLPILHYSLRSSGILFLGSSESIGPFTDLFDVVDATQRIFVKKPGQAQATLDFGDFPAAGGAGRRLVRDEGSTFWTASDVQKEADRVVLARFAPVGVIVDETGTVVQFRGRTSAYLEPAPGMASLDFLRMLRENLLMELRAALVQAKTENVIVVKEGLRVVGDHGVTQVRAEVIPFKVPPSGIRFFLVLFQDQLETSPPEADAGERLTLSRNSEITHLQEELAAVREYLQSVIEEHESANEELKSANEEILSANEELQSTNEELQTAKEESQSANEELATVNEELLHRNSDMGRVNNDLINLLSGVNIPIVMVNRDLRIRRFTPQAEKVFNLIPTDVGRPISDIKPNLEIHDLPACIASVIDSLTPYECETKGPEGKSYCLRVRPYVTLDNKIDGASIVLLELDSMRQGLPQTGPPESDTTQQS